MPIKIPSLDDRRYQQLVEESLARIPTHEPEWSNFNASDPGVTLIQLFAFSPSCCFTARAKSQSTTATDFSNSSAYLFASRRWQEMISHPG